MSTTQILDAPPPSAVSPSAVSPSAVSPSAAPAAPIAPVGPRRDRLVDVLRVFAVVVVVAEHWLMPVLSYEGGRLRTGNAYAAVPGGWATWIGQVMPLVFFAGGAAAAMSLTARRRRQGDISATTTVWLGDRLRRLAWPVLPLAAVWVPLPHLLDLIGLPDGPVHQAARLVGQLIWFLAVYVVVIALTPALIRAYRRWRGLELVVLVAAAVLVDLVGSGSSAARPPWVTPTWSSSGPPSTTSASSTDPAAWRGGVVGGR
ncbi:MAG TPA: acyltransferase family protein [Jiangellaceae bacterium]